MPLTEDQTNIIEDDKSNSSHSNLSNVELFYKARQNEDQKLDKKD